MCSIWTSLRSIALGVPNALRVGHGDHRHAAGPQFGQDTKLPMRRCIYCDRDKDDGEFTDEHIWPDGLGGDYLPKDVWRTDDVCGRCNNLSGLFVDGGFIRGWAGTAERFTGAYEYLKRPSPGVLPLAYMGRLPDADCADSDIAEFWLGPCGAHIVHIRPQDTQDDWSAYAGGDPRAKKLAAGRAYLSFTSEQPFWVVASLNSFRAHFRKASRFIVNAAVPSQWSDAFTEVNRSDPQQQRDLKVVDAVASKASKGETVHSRVILAVDTGSRLLAKIALALGYKLLGRDFLATSYAADLRKALWERDFSARQQIPVRGSGYLHGANPLGAVTYPMAWPGGWVLLVKVVEGKLACSVFTPSGKAMVIMICDDASLVAKLPGEYIEGQVWLAVPTLAKSAGPFGLAAFLGHVTGNAPIADLQSIEAERADPSLLPKCR